MGIWDIYGSTAFATFSAGEYLGLFLDGLLQGRHLQRHGLLRGLARVATRGGGFVAKMVGNLLGKIPDLVNIPKTIRNLPALNR